MNHRNVSRGLDIWAQPLSFMGLEVGTRMTVIHLGGKLFVHSPVRLTAEIKDRLDGLGEVAYVVAPNKWHHLFLSDFKAAYPHAKFFCAPGLQKKRADFPFDAVISPTQNQPWNPEIEHLLIEGAPQFDEVAFFHRASRTLLLTDTALHICEPAPFKTKLIFKLMGTLNKFGLSKLEKKLFIKDQRAFDASMKKVSRWDFDRIILAHGNVIEHGGKEEFKKAYL